MRFDKVPSEAGFEPAIPGGEPRCFNHFSYSSVAVGTFGNTRHVGELNPAGGDRLSKAWLCVPLCPYNTKLFQENRGKKVANSENHF